MVSQRTAFFMWIVLLVVIFLLIGNHRPETETPLRKVSTEDRYKHDSLWHQSKGKRASSISLSPGVIKGIKRFVLIIGYQESRQSVVGTLMNAHPHIIIAESFDDHLGVLESSKKHQKEPFFNSIYRRSNSEATKVQSPQCNSGADWHGRFDKHIDIIGADYKGISLASYMENREELMKWYLALKKTISIPLSVIHILQNPFDIIPSENPGLAKNADSIRYNLNKLTANSKDASTNSSGILLSQRINSKLQELDAVMKLIDIFGRNNVLDVHNCDLVADPKRIFSKVFDFLGVKATEHYLDMCAERVSKSVPISRPRDSIAWTADQIKRVEQSVQRHKMLSRYSFTSD